VRFGTVTTVLFTFTNLKLYWRVTWLIEQLKVHSEFYADYLAIRDFEDFRRVGVGLLAGCSALWHRRKLERRCRAGLIAAGSSHGLMSYFGERVDCTRSGKRVFPQPELKESPNKKLDE